MPLGHNLYRRLIMIVCLTLVESLFVAVARALALAVPVLCLLPAPAEGLEIYIDTNYRPSVGLGSQLYDTSKWSETASKVDGIYYLSQGMTVPPPGKKLSEARRDFVTAFRNKKFILEFHYPQLQAYNRKPADIRIPLDIRILRSAGITDWNAMVYWEKRVHSTLLHADLPLVQTFFRSLGRSDRLYVLNTRGWTRSLRDELAKGSVTGLSLEWAPYRMSDSWILREVGAAIKFAAEKERILYLLINAEKSTNYLHDIQRTFRLLTQCCSGQLRSQNVKIILANYKHPTAIPFVPEKDSHGNPADTLTGAALWFIRAADAAGLRTAPQPSPYGDTLRPLPGVIQAEDFDTGGKGLGYVDRTTSNAGNAYRLAEDVDIEPTSDTGGGYNIGSTRAGENLRYTVDVAASGGYRLEARVASDGPGGTFHLEANGVDVTGPIKVPDTDGWQTWQTLTNSNVSLRQGKNVVRLIMDEESNSGNVGNINWLRFERLVSTNY